MKARNSLFSKSALAVAAATAMLVGAACSESDDKGIDSPENNTAYSPISLSRAEQDIVDTQNIFALKLYNSVAATGSNATSNFMISPVSVSMLMSVLSNGADGDTRTQIVEALGFGDADMDDVNALNSRLVRELTAADNRTTLSFANSGWLHSDFTVLDGFSSACRDNYGMEFANVNLHSADAVSQINAWVNRNTEGLIEKVFDSPFDEDIRMVLANAVYFSGIWPEPFDKGATRAHKFTNADGSQSTVQMMKNTKASGSSLHLDGVSVASLEYGNGAFNLGLVLPHKGESLADIMSDVNGETVNGWIEGLNRQVLDIDLPRFDIEYSLDDMSGNLKALGISDAFNEAAADFSLLSKEKVYLSRVLHKTHITVNEEGTKAAAVTTGGMATAPLPESFTFDRPFAFFIYEKSTKAILFMGTVNKL